MISFATLIIIEEFSFNKKLTKKYQKKVENFFEKFFKYKNFW